MAGATRKVASNIEELINRKFRELETTVASKEGIEDLKLLIMEQNEKIEKQNLEILSLKATVLSQEKNLSNMNDKIAVLSNSIDVLKKQSDNQEQYSRRYCLRVKGIEKENYETPNTCIDKVVKVCKNLDVDINASDIDRAHRVGKDNKAIIVKFFDFKKRTALYRNRKKKEMGPIKIHLDLTKHRLDLLDKTKSLINKSSNVDFVFADINCNTVAKLKNNEFMFFDSVKKFEEILSMTP